MQATQWATSPSVARGASTAQLTVQGSQALYGNQALWGDQALWADSTFGD